MVQDHSSPATKQDITVLMESVGKLYDDIHNFKVEVKEDVTQQIAASEDRMKKHMTGVEERMKRHFDVVAEDLRHDVLGANRDEIEGIKDRVVRIERHVGLQAA